MLPRYNDIGAGGDVPFHVFVLLEVVPVRLENGEDGLRRGVGRKALPEHQNVERIEAWRLKADVRCDFAGRVHLRDVGCEQKTLCGELVAPGLLCVHHPVLFTGRVAVVATCGEAGLHHFAAVLDKRADHVADEARALEQLCQRFDRVLDFDDFIVRGLDARNLVDDGLDLGLVAAGSDEWNIVFAQIFADEAAGVTGHAIDDDGSLVAHVKILPVI